MKPHPAMRAAAALAFLIAAALLAPPAGEAKPAKPMKLVGRATLESNVNRLPHGLGSAIVLSQCLMMGRDHEGASRGDGTEARS